MNYTQVLFKSTTLFTKKCITKINKLNKEFVCRFLYFKKRVVLYDNGKNM